MSYTEEYIKKINELFGKVGTSLSPDAALGLDESVAKVIELLKKAKASGNKVIFIGNGASAALSSHHSADYSKSGGIPSICFSDASILTCLSNDYGYEHVFEKQIQIFAKKGDILFAISSSGASKNILRAADAAKEKGMAIVSFSGFAANNPLKAKGDINFYVPSNAYGIIETIHTALCHLILDAFLKTKLEV